MTQITKLSCAVHESYALCRGKIAASVDCYAQSVDTPTRFWGTDGMYVDNPDQVMIDRYDFTSTCRSGDPPLRVVAGCTITTTIQHKPSTEY